MNICKHFLLIDKKYFKDEAVKGASPEGIGAPKVRKPLTAEVQNITIKKKEMHHLILSDLVAIFKKLICPFSAEPAH